MQKTLLTTLLISLCCICLGYARTWTDVQGRKIDAELLRVEGEKVVLKFKGKEVKFAITKLCTDDQDYIKEWQKEQEDKPADTAEDIGELTLCGTTLKKNGATTIVEQEVNGKVQKAYSKATEKPSKIKIAIALPNGFDPNKPQRVMWVSAAINNEGERKRGNIGAMGGYAKTATQTGWVIIAVDADIGNPRRPAGENSSGGDLAIHTQAIETISAAWPAFKNWEFACCGFSGGAKVSFCRVGNLLVNKLNVIGLFLAGCNQDFTETSRSENRFRKSSLRKIKVWISNGKGDTISTVSHAESLEKSVKANRFGDTKLQLFEGGHVISQEGFADAMKWFIAP